MKYKTKFTKEYLEFREKLSFDEVMNLRARFINLCNSGQLPENELTKLEIESGTKFHVYMDRKTLTIWLLGGHWVRTGEPGKEFMAKMQEYAANLKLGIDPEEAC